MRALVAVFWGHHPRPPLPPRTGPSLPSGDSSNSDVASALRRCSEPSPLAGAAMAELRAHLQVGHWGARSREQGRAHSSPFTPGTAGGETGGPAKSRLDREALNYGNCLDFKLGHQRSGRQCAGRFGLRIALPPRPASGGKSKKSEPVCPRDGRLGGAGGLGASTGEGRTLWDKMPPAAWGKRRRSRPRGRGAGSGTHAGLPRFQRSCSAY